VPPGPVRSSAGSQTCGTAQIPCISSLVVVDENVVDDDVYGDGFQADLVAQGGDDVLLDVPGYLVYGVSVADRHGKVDDCGAAQYTHGGVGVTVLEGGRLGERG
jgi:hypothetical protein